MFRKCFYIKLNWITRVSLEVSEISSFNELSFSEVSKRIFTLRLLQGCFKLFLIIISSLFEERNVTQQLNSRFRVCRGLQCRKIMRQRQKARMQIILSVAFTSQSLSMFALLGRYVNLPSTINICTHTSSDGNSGDVKSASHAKLSLVVKP